MSIVNSLIKLGEKAAEKGGVKTAEKASKNVAEKKVNKALTTGGYSTSSAQLSNLLPGAELAGVGGTKLAEKSGSALDGILGESSGVVLPNATKKTLQDYGESSIGSLIGDDLTPKDLAKSGVSARTIRKLKNAADEGALLEREAFEAKNASGARTKTDLPTLNRENYYLDNKGSVRNGEMAYKDTPDYMQTHLTNPKDNYDKMVRGDNEEILRTFFNDQDSSLSELYEKYDELARAENANLKFTGDNIDTGLMLGDEKSRKALEQDFADELFGMKKNIKVEGGQSGAKKINVERPEAALGDKATITDTQSAGENAGEALQDEIQAIKTGGTTNEGYANAGASGTTSNTTTQKPGNEGFGVKLKNGENIDITLKPTAAKETIKKNKAVRNLDDMWAKDLNATPTLYKEAVGKSRSAYKGYSTPAEMARLNSISRDNISTMPQAVVSSLEDSKNNIVRYAEDNGVVVDLGKIDLSNIEPSTKATMKMQGIDPDKIKYTGVASPLEAETLYKDLRNRAVKTTDGDRAVAYNAMADYVRGQIDNTLDTLNIDFSYQISDALSNALGKQADLNYLRDIGNNKNLKFSDLRREQADWIKVANMSGRPFKEDPTISVFGFDTGVKNPVTAGVNKAKEEFYKKQAYGGNGGGGEVPPTGTTGASGAENNINFTGETGGQSKLQSLLSKGKNAGLAGAGVLGGLLLGGGGNGNSTSDMSTGTLGSMLGSTGYAVQEDPYSTITLGGYTYDQLEQGYVSALSAGDSKAAAAIKDMLDTLSSKIERYQEQYGSSTSSSASNGLNALQSLYSLYQQAGGSQGFVQGNITNFLNQFGGAYNKTMATYEALKDSSTPMIARALGEKGVLSDQDRASVKAALPSASDDPETAERKFMALYNQIMAASNE